MEEQLIPIGIVVILIGFTLLIIGSVLSALKSKQGKIEGGGIIFIGPIPIVGATSERMLYFILIASVIFLLLFLLLNLIGR